MLSSAAANAAGAFDHAVANNRHRPLTHNGVPAFGAHNAAHGGVIGAFGQIAFRFGLQAFNPKSPGAWREMLRKVEDLGYSSYHLADHILGPGPAIESTAHPPQLLAAVPAMAMALEYTDRIKVGARVFCMDYRDPVMLAKEAATMDYLSDGRLELGLGAGWIQADYEAIGMPFKPIGERLYDHQPISVVGDAAGHESGE